MTGERPYWNMDMEPLLNSAAMREIQARKAGALVDRLWEAKPFWRDRFKAAGIRPGAIRSLADFAAAVPIIDKAQRRRLAEDCDMDMLEVVDRTIGVPLDRVRLMASTSGTTGEPTFYPLTDGDFRTMGECYSRMFWRMGMRRGDRVIQGFGLSMTMAGTPYLRFAQDFGATTIPVGAEGGTQRLLKFAKYLHADTIFGTPSLVEHLIEKAPEVLGADIASLGIKRLMCAGEPGAGLPEVRRRIEAAYGATLYDAGAGFGVSSANPDYSGLYWIADDLVLYELVDPDTHAPIPLEDGATGMAVMTTFDGEGFLCVRESFGDINQVFVSPNGDGLTGLRFKVIGRTDDMLKVKGQIVYPAAIDGVIAGFQPRLTGEFRIMLDCPPPRVVPPLRLKVEHAAGLPTDALDALAGEVEDRMHAKLKFRPAIEWVPSGTLERAVLKTSFFEKAYEAAR